MPSNSLTPEKLETLIDGYRQAQLVLSANYLGVFRTISYDSKTLDEINQSLKLSYRGLRILCDALASLGVLIKQGDRYQNSEAARQLLLPESPDSKISLFLHHAQLYQSWGRLYDSVRTGTKVNDEVVDTALGRSEAAFAHAMRDAGRKGAEETAQKLDLTGVSKLLDLGGGPGLYAIECAKRNPDLHAVVFDTEETLEVTKENIQQEGLQDRVSTQAGDALNDSYGEGYDFILISNFVHIFSSNINQNVIQKCAAALNPNGRVCVKDFLVDESRTEPEWCSLFAVNMLVNTEGGDCYTLSDIQQWYKAAGLRYESHLPVAVHSSLVIGRKG